MVDEGPVVLFDGVCNLCNASVQFILKHEKKSSLKFAPRQSEKAKELLKPFAHLEISDSVLLIENNKLYQKTKAVARIARHLKYFWILFYLVYYLPSIISNPVYDWIARNRYQWFGKQAQCMIPSDELKSRFLI